MCALKCRLRPGLDVVKAGYELGDLVNFDRWASERERERLSLLNTDEAGEDEQHNHGRKAASSTSPAKSSRGLRERRLN